MNNKVSIIMPVFNAEKYISYAIESVLSQTFTDFEFIIIDDCSTDNSPSLINDFAQKDSRIRIIRNKQNLKIVKSLNIGLQNAKYEYIARIDADDIWANNKLEIQVNYLNNNPKHCMVATFAKIIDENGASLQPSFKQFSDSKDIQKYLPKFNFIVHSSVVFRKSVIEELGGYREKYFHAEDYDLWLRMIAQELEFAVLSDYLLEYRVTPESINLTHWKEQNKNVYFLKMHFYKKTGFKFNYIPALLRNLYYWLFPKWLINFKKVFA